MSERSRSWWGMQAAIGACGAALLVLVFSDTNRLSAGPFWDFAAALGYVGFVGLVILSLSANKPIAHNVHQRIAYLTVGFCLAHTLLLALGDGAIATYMRWGTPFYMWAGLIALVLIASLVLHSEAPLRRRLHPQFRHYRQWHRYLAIVSIALVGWHTIGSGFYIPARTQAWLLGLVCLVAMLRPWLRRELMPLLPGGAVGFGVVSVIFVSAFMLAHRLSG